MPNGGEKERLTVTLQKGRSSKVTSRLQIVMSSYFGQPATITIVSGYETMVNRQTERQSERG